MKTQKINKWLGMSIIAITLLSLVFAATPVSAQGNERGLGPGSRRGGTGVGMGGQVVAAPLSAAEQDALNQAILEEYGAYNTYQAIIANLGDVYPFSRIVNVEQQHVNVLLRLAQRYGVTPPANPGLEAPLAVNTLADACGIGVAAEISDADLYTELLKVVTHADVQQVFTNLQQASLQQHLPAFQACD